MTSRLVLAFLLAGLSAGNASGQAPPRLVGIWEVVYDLGGAERALRFEAKADGTASFLVVDARSSLNEPPEPSSARWQAVAGEKVKVTGAVEFPIGNVGREPGTLVLTGAFDGAHVLRGSVAFYGQDQDVKDPKVTPRKTGSFKATRRP